MAEGEPVRNKAVTNRSLPRLPLRFNKEGHLVKTKILRNTFLNLGMVFGLAIAARAQNLYVSLQGPFLTNSGGSLPALPNAVY
jgi:hypothetical protein